MTRTKADWVVRYGYALIALGLMLWLVSLFLMEYTYFYFDLLGIVVLVLGIIVMVGGIILKATEKPPPPKSPVITKERETITTVKEVVMVPCQYCGGLMPQTSIYCPHCGASVKRGR